MVQTDKVTGQMTIYDDGTVISSSGDLSSNESSAQQIITLISHAFPIALRKVEVVPTTVPPPTSSTNNQGKATNNSTTAPVNGSTAIGDNNGAVSTAGLVAPPKFRRIIRPFHWKSITVDFGDHAYIACLSNRKVHVIKRVKVPSAETQEV